MRHYLNAADAFLFASKSETQGIVLLEAMAAGCPVAAVRASGVVDVVRQGINGYMIEAVSYTHLDVYKRQVYSITRDFLFEKGFGLFVSAGTMTAVCQRRCR